MRTPLNCVQMGLELAISQAKLLDVSDIPKIHTGPRRDSLGEFSKSCSRANDSLLDTLETAYSSCQTAIEILNDSLNYDKLEAEEMTLNISKVPLQTLIEKSLCPFLIQAHQYNVSLDYHIPESLRYLSVTVDFNRFSQVIRNLVSNSLKFTPSGGKITVSVSEQKNMNSTIFFDSDSSLTDELSSISRNSSRHPQGGDYLRIDISDTGAGMSKVHTPSCETNLT